MLRSQATSATPVRCESGPPANRRRQPRYEVLGKAARLDALGDVGLCRVIDMSDGGMMIETAISLSCGDPVRISFDCTNAIQGRVVWCRGTRGGIRFLAPINSLELVRKTARKDQVTRPPRIPVNCAGWASSQLGRFPTVVGNISQTGMKICHSGTLPIGTSIEITLDCGLTASGTVCWSNGTFAGVELARAISPQQLASARAL